MRKGWLDEWMWSRAFAALNEAERRAQQFFDATDRCQVWQAPIDVFENGGGLVVWVALPGVDPSRVEVVLDGRILRVSGVRALVVDPPQATIRRLEIPYGRFERVLELPRTGYVVVARQDAHGCLRLELHHD